MVNLLSEFISFISGMVIILIAWYVSSSDDRRQYRIGYRDGYNDGLEKGTKGKEQND